MAAANERLEKVFLTLDEKYSSGKINKEQYEKLKERKKDITIDFIVVAKPGRDFA